MPLDAGREADAVCHYLRLSQAGNSNLRLLFTNVRRAGRNLGYDCVRASSELTIARGLSPFYRPRKVLLTSSLSSRLWPVSVSTIWPILNTYARWAISSASEAFCSTTRMVASVAGWSVPGFLGYRQQFHRQLPLTNRIFLTTEAGVSGLTVPLGAV